MEINLRHNQGAGTLSSYSFPQCLVCSIEITVLLRGKEYFKATSPTQLSCRRRIWISFPWQGDLAGLWTGFGRSNKWWLRLWKLFDVKGTKRFIIPTVHSHIVIAKRMQIKCEKNQYILLYKYFTIYICSIIYNSLRWLIVILWKNSSEWAKVNVTSPTKIMVLYLRMSGIIIGICF